MAFYIENVDWVSGKNRLSQLREQVFVLEWRLPREAEFDEHDSEAFHVLVTNDERVPIATGRLTKAGEIGRIAVKPPYRNPEVYKTLFHSLITLAQTANIKQLKVICDLDSVAHHEALGFHCCGPVFMEAGIARQQMACAVDEFPLPDVTHMH